MQAFCIDKRILGTEAHLASDGKGYAWVDTVPSSMWHLSGRFDGQSQKNLDVVLMLANRSVDVFPSEIHRLAIEPIVGESTQVVPWAWTMTSRAHRTFVKKLVECVVVAMAGLDMSYYEATWVPESRVFAALQPARLNVMRWRALLDQAGANVSVLESFRPNRAGFCQRVCYNRFASRTGRLTVEQGPQILTLNRDHRDIIMSEYGDAGSVVQMDFNALEIRALFYEGGNAEVTEDLYVTLGRLFHRSIDRSLIKEIVIPALYGQSPAALSERIKLEVDELRMFMTSIRTQFNIEALLQRLRRQNLELNEIKNHHGRSLHVPASTDHILLNTFAQSTGVDIALLGFSWITDNLPPSARPLFLIHDALILDIKKDELSALYALKQVLVPGFDQRFLLKVDDF